MRGNFLIGYPPQSYIQDISTGTRYGRCEIRITGEALDPGQNFAQEDAYGSNVSPKQLSAAKKWKQRNPLRGLCVLA